MKEITGTLVSLHGGGDEDYDEADRGCVELALDGFPGDKHRGFQRIAQSWDPEPNGTVRRNERQWSGVSLEELETIRERMDLRDRLSAATLRANVCIQGVPDFSQLPKGSKLVFPSGAVLLVEEENPPCSWVGDQISLRHTTRSGEPARGKLFPRQAMGLRGVVGVVDVPGTIRSGEPVVVKIYEP